MLDGDLEGESRRRHCSVLDHKFTVLCRCLVRGAAGAETRNGDPMAVRGEMAKCS